MMMLIIREEQLARLDQGAEARFRARLSVVIRQRHGTYVDDLTDDELSVFVDAAASEARLLGLTSESELFAFVRPCVIYGALSHCDPLFEPIFCSKLPGVDGARRRRSPSGMNAALNEVLAAEFEHRSGRQLILDLARVFLDGTPPRLSPAETLTRFFPERASRLADGVLAAHLMVAAKEADRLGLEGPGARRVHAEVALLLGACFGRDPLYPWAMRAFRPDLDEQRQISRLRAGLTQIARSAEEGRG